MNIDFSNNFSFFVNKDPEDFLFNDVVYTLQQGYEAQRHVKAFVYFSYTIKEQHGEHSMCNVPPALDISIHM